MKKDNELGNPMSLASLKKDLSSFNPNKKGCKNRKGALGN